MNSDCRFELCQKSANPKVKPDETFPSWTEENDVKAGGDLLPLDVFSSQRKQPTKLKRQRFVDMFMDIDQSDAAELECKFCQKLFHHSDHLNEHMKMHQTLQMYECLSCQSIFSSADQLTQHMMDMHSIEKLTSSSYRCMHCLDIFPLQNAHVCKMLQNANSAVEGDKSNKTNAANKTFKCPTCSKVFLRASYLAIHARVHTGERSFVCKICEKSFTQASHLSGHMKVHTGDKPFSCDFCQKKFALSGNLTKHLRVHTGERPFHCSYCSRSFSQSNSLAVHTASTLGRNLINVRSASRISHVRVT